MGERMRYVGPFTQLFRETRCRIFGHYNLNRHPHCPHCGTKMFSHPEAEAMHLEDQTQSANEQLAAEREERGE